MSIKDRLKTAYENVALNGDTTWTDLINTFQEANKKLFSKEQQIQNIRIIEERPRTVKDSIPNSKLATYNDFEYNEARELCYTKCIQKTQIEFLSEKSSRDGLDEPWLLSDVDTLFLWFICCQNQKRSDCGAFEYCEEHGIRYHETMEEEEISFISPLLNANGFQEKKLKMAIISDKVKIIWNTQQDDLRQRCFAFARDIDLTLSKLPSFQISNATSDPRGQGPLLDEVSESSNKFIHLKDLPTSFKQQNGWMSKSPIIIQPKPEPVEPRIEEPCLENNKVDEPVCPKRLYSAVLQGLTTTEIEKKESNSLPKIVSKTDTSNSILPEISVYSAFSVDPDLNSPEFNSTSIQLNDENFDQSNKSEMITQKKPSIQPNLIFFSKTKSVDSTSSMKTSIDIRETVQQNNEDFRSSNAISLPVLPQSTYVNNYSYQFNTHYSNTYQNSCGCANTFSHTSHVIASRNMSTFQRHTTFLPGQYQYAHPVLMLQHNRASLYPVSQPIQTPYYLQPLQQTRVMQRWILPQNYSRVHVNQASFVNPHFVHQNPSLWLGPNKHVPPTPQYFIDNRFRPKSRRTTQPEMNIAKSKPLKIREEGSASTGTADSELMRKSLEANSTSSRLNVSMSQQHNKQETPSQLKVKSDIDEIVNKTVNILFEEDTTVTSTISEELEIQAIEQYCNSTDNVYQELERQAAEQYDELSENSRCPPTKGFLFGGLNSFLPCSIDVNV